MIGSREWMNLTQGRLSAKEKRQMVQQIVMPISIAYAQRLFKNQALTSDLRLENIQLPDTAIVLEAIDALSHCGSTPIIQHSWRCFFWAVAIAKFKAWDFDVESVIIASLMHDLGLVDLPPNDQCHCFTYASALKAEALCEKHAMPQAQSHNIADAICLHMNGHLNPKDPQLSHEVLLLQQATACDVIGTEMGLIHPAYRAQVLEHYPRANFNQAFKGYLKQEALRHPHSRTALLKQLGMPLMIKSNGFGE